MLLGLREGTEQQVILDLRWILEYMPRKCQMGVAEGDRLGEFCYCVRHGALTLKSK